MTKSTITREESIQAVFDLKVGYTLGLADIEILKRAARMALAVIESEPVAWRWNYGGTTIWRLLDTKPGPGSNPRCPRVIEPLYRHAQPAPVVPPEQHWEELCRQHPDMIIGDAIIRAAWWNHCRAAMLQASPVCTCPSGDGSLRWPCPVHADNSPTQSDCCPAQNGVSPAQDGNSPATSDNWQVEAEKLAEMHGMSFVMFRHGEAPQCADPTKVVISFTDKGLGHDTLPAATQEVKGE